MVGGFSRSSFQRLSVLATRSVSRGKLKIFYMCYHRFCPIHRAGCGLVSCTQQAQRFRRCALHLGIPPTFFGDQLLGICVGHFLFERSEFLIDTPHKKNLRVCPRACQIILVLVFTYVSTTYVRKSARYQPATKIRICIYVCARVGYVLCATYVRKLV